MSDDADSGDGSDDSTDGHENTAGGSNDVEATATINTDESTAPIGATQHASHHPRDSRDSRDPEDAHPARDRSDTPSRPARQLASDRRRRAVRQLLFVIAGSHTGAFLGSSLPTRFGLPGDVSGVLLVVLLFVLPFAVDAKWERIEATTDRIGL